MQAITTPEIVALAGSIGVSLTDHQSGPKGLYDNRTRTISLRTGLSERAYRSTLAHELGHAFHGDELTGVDWIDYRMEKRANNFATNLLIDHRHYATAEDLHGPHDDMIAHELGVTRYLLAHWRDTYERKSA